MKCGRPCAKREERQDDRGHTPPPRVTNSLSGRRRHERERESSRRAVCHTRTRNGHIGERAQGRHSQAPQAVSRRLPARDRGDAGRWRRGGIRTPISGGCADAAIVAATCAARRRRHLRTWPRRQALAEGNNWISTALWRRKIAQAKLSQTTSDRYAARLVGMFRGSSA